ncbi:hypothetical protein HF908_04780 [Ralstonia pseudosolanacearum]|uniref:Lipoprotein n=2 Tax=Ralstonia TaxID=48736 RepID=A0AA92QCV8_RALSL|nr:hypothetical protein HF908_04780 [Ralstonia pseudosolanacearum]QOK98234.1 hypothetical protein HF909_04620 [Ralstonia pseudosolanacearum]
MMDPTPKRRVTFLPGVLALCAATLLGGCVVAPYYDAYGNPVAVAPAAYPYPAYPYDYYGPAYYPAPVYGSLWFGYSSGGCWGCHRGWDGRGRGGWGGRGWRH